jgi:hypothetical protein
MDYLQWVEHEATLRYDRGMRAEEAMRIGLGQFAEMEGWSE